MQVEPLLLVAFAPKIEVHTHSYLIVPLQAFQSVTQFLPRGLQPFECCNQRFNHKRLASKLDFQDNLGDANLNHHTWPFWVLLNPRDSFFKLVSVVTVCESVLLI